MSRRIALISEHASPLAMLGGVDAGGQNVYVAQLARQLGRLGERVDVFTRRDAPDLPEVVPFAPGVRIVHVDAGPPRPVPKEALLPFMPAFTGRMLQRLAADSHAYDLVHANFFLSGLVACELKAEVGLPFVVTFHALGRVRRQFHGAADGFPDERFAIEDRIVAEADRLIAECPQDEEDLIRLYNADPARISIVPCGFDPAEFSPMSRPLARLELGLDPAERILLQLGRMVPRKGVDTVIRALATLDRDYGLTARLLVVGGATREPDPEATPELRRLMEIAADAGVAERVTFVGRRDRQELARYYNAADIFVSTPWYEPFGITPLEAMACGTPVLGSNVGGIKFTVRDGETGYLVPPNDPAALAERAAHLYRHPKLLAVQGRQAIRRVNDLFTWDRVAGGVAAAYEEVTVSGRLARRQESVRLETVDRRFDGAIWALRESRRRLRSSILEAAEAITATFARERKLLIAGSAGSAAEAQHFAAQLVGRFRLAGRPALPAIALGPEAAVASGATDGAGGEDVVARQVEAFGSPGDLLIGLSAGGAGASLARGFEAARARDLRTLALVGGDGGELRGLADLAVIVPATDTQHVQEVHAVLVNTLCEIVEQTLTDSGWFAGRHPVVRGPGWVGSPVPIVPPAPHGTGPRAASRAGGAS